MLSLNERLTLRDLIEQGWKQVQQEVLEQLRRTIEGLLAVERDRRVAEARQGGQKVYRWGYTVRKCWTTLWGTLHQIRVPRLRGAAEIGLLEKYQRHDLGQVLFALTVGGLSQRKVVDWMRRFAGGTLSVATLHAVLARAQQDIVARRTAPGRAYSHRIPLVKLKCISPKRWMELAARRRGEEPGGARQVQSQRHGRPCPLLRSGA